MLTLFSLVHVKGMGNIRASTALELIWTLSEKSINKYCHKTNLENHESAQSSMLNADYGGHVQAMKPTKRSSIQRRKQQALITDVKFISYPIPLDLFSVLILVR
jgi:hypothetical protein